MKMACSAQYQRLVALAVACLAVMMSGTIQTFAAFGADMKEEFSLSQSQRKADMHCIRKANILECV